MREFQDDLSVTLLDRSSPMQPRFAPAALSRVSARWASYLLLFLMVVMQVQMAYAGCVMKLSAAPDTQAAAAIDHCHPDNDETRRACLRHCEQTGDSLTSGLDRPAPTDVGLYPTFCVTQAVADPSGHRHASRRIDQPAAIGPPIYLRFAHLRN